MGTTIIVAAMGFAATLLGTWCPPVYSVREIVKGGSSMRGSASTANVPTACTNTRVLPTTKRKPDSSDLLTIEGLRQEAYRCNARARSAIGQAAIFSGLESLEERLATARNAIGDLNDASDHADLKRRQEDVFKLLNHTLGIASSDLMTRPTGARARARAVFDRSG